MDAHESLALQGLSIYYVGAAVRCDLKDGVVRMDERESDIALVQLKGSLEWGSIRLCP